jgi:IclR family transcriptional regulator, pca regulon regulatory protein
VTELDAEDATSRHFVQSLARGLAVIRAFDVSHQELTLPELAVRADVSRAAARRFVLTLVELGYMESDDGRLYRLTPQILQLGYPYMSGYSLGRLASPHLARLSADIGQHTAAAVLDDMDIAYIASIRSDRLMALDVEVGSRLPAYVTSMGRVLLADLDAADLDSYLDRVRPDALTAVTETDPAALRRIVAAAAEDGYATIVQELDPVLKSLSVPLRGSSGRVVAAANISMRLGLGRDRDDERAELLQHLPRLLACAEAIERDVIAAGR